MATLLSDAFTGSNGTALVSRAMSGTPAKSWSEFNGTFTIQSNAATYASSSGLYSILYADADASDVVITADLSFPSASDYIIGLCFRVVDANNLWFVVASRSGGGAITATIFDRTSGTETPGSQVTYLGVVSGTTQTFTVTLSGNTIDCTTTDQAHSDLVLATMTSSTRATSRKHGIQGYANGSYTAGSIDNFLVTGTALGGGLSLPVLMNTQRQFRNYQKRPSGVWTPERNIVIA